MKFRVGACALLVCLAGCSGKGPNTDFAELRGAAATKGAAGQLPKLHLGRVAAKSIANAPDRGALVSYQNKGAPTKREGAFTYYPVAISEDHALKALVTGEMSMPMPDGSQVKLKYERHDESPDGNWTWIGRVVGGDPQQEAIVTFGEKAVFASIPQANGAPPLSIQTRNGALFAVQTDPSKVKSPNKGHNDMLVPAALAVREAAAAQVQANAQVSQNAIAQNAPPTSANTVDVAIGYTAGYRATYGSQSAATTRLTFLVQVGNQAYSNSVINGYLRLVSATEVAYTDGNANQTALHELTGSNGTANVAIPASLTPLRTARDQYGADIAILVRDFQQPEHQGCGIAWLIGANQQAIVPSDASWAYAVVSDGDDQGTDGQSYYCAPETLVHEASHLMGSAHDVANSPNTSGRYPYSYGYKTTNGNFYTVMAYGDEGQTPYRVFSNPNISTCGGNACGVANQADNARSLNQTIPVVAQFRTSTVPFDKTRADINGDGRSDVHWYQQSSGTLNAWLMSGSTVLGSTRDVASASCTPRAFGDLNGDSISDVVLTCAGDARVHAWLSSPTGYSRQVAGYYAAGWEITTAADINGDGYDDIIWKQSTANATNINVWHMRGSEVLSSFAKAAPAACNVAGAGDINGDAKEDIALSCADSSVYVLFGVTNDFVQFKVGNAWPTWTLVGSIDANGDGKNDLVWHQPSTGLINTWLMNGTLVSSSFLHLVPTDCIPKSYADYNGDGLGDIGLMCSSNRSAQVLLGTGSNFNRIVAGYYADGWTIVQ
ncbi:MULTISPECIES: reprolysin-like metallopeptidase [unclassified Pseudoxanthomonas]|uniref:reprolysin-like metallopeptidase n=1 Tax=unclassified Pseudoxanthomonas TaxID=2645906 RepID=UPI003077C6D4